MTVFNVELKPHATGLIEMVWLNGTCIGHLFLDSRKFMTTKHLDDDLVQRVRVEIDKLTDVPVQATSQPPAITEEEMYGDTDDESSSIIP